jgi:hypothetical protein
MRSLNDIDKRNIIPLNEKDKVLSEVYLITNKINNKKYVGQAVSHILNHGKYRKYGSIKRFNCHVSEAYSQKKKQCFYLNNAIKKYKKENFNITILCVSDKNNIDYWEDYYIKEYNTLFPNGYNLKTGGQNFIPTLESRKRVSIGVKKYFYNKKIQKYKNIKITDTFDYLLKRIKPLYRKKVQYGWYFTYKNKKVDFGGIHTSVEQSKKDIINFIKIIYENNATHLEAGNS